MSDVKEEKKVEIKHEDIQESKKGTKKEEKPKDEKKKTGMALRRYRPLSTFRQMDRFFNDLTSWFDDFFWSPTRFWDLEPLSLREFDEDSFFRTPLAKITEDDDNFNITAELPGLDKGDVEITIHDGNLEIKGDQKEEYEEKKDGRVRKEYSSSSYYRCFSLPENIEEDKIEANLNNGLLKLKLPKKEEEKKEKKKIEVK